MNDNKVFAILDGNGTITRLVEAQNEKSVRAFLLKDVEITKPSSLTVARLMEGGMKTEKA